MQTSLSATEDGMIFSRKTFVLYGFEDESIPVLTEYIIENGGMKLLYQLWIARMAIAEI